jgi:hypothetical protein
MSDGLARLEALRALRDAAPQPAPVMEGEPPTVPVPPTKGRGRRGTTAGRPRGTSGQDNYLDQITPDAAADLARLALALRHAIAAAGKTPAEVAKTSGYWRLTGMVRLDLHQVRRMRLSTLERICEAAGMPSNAAADMASTAPHAIAPEEAPK